VLKSRIQHQQVRQMFMTVRDYRLLDPDQDSQWIRIRSEFDSEFTSEFRSSDHSESWSGSDNRI